MLMPAIRKIYRGEGTTREYLLCGFMLSILLGIYAIYVYGHATKLSYYDSDRFRLKVAIAAGIGLLLSTTFLYWISVGIWRYFKRSGSVAAKVILALGILHLPITGLTILILFLDFAVAVKLLYLSLSYHLFHP